MNGRADLTVVQAQMLARVVGHFDAHPEAELLVCMFDVAQGRNVICGGTTDAAGLLFAAGLVMLRRAYECLLEQQTWPNRDAMLEALRTAMPFLEASGVAEPGASRAVVQ